jgi:hypothetical protein
MKNTKSAFFAICFEMESSKEISFLFFIESYLGFIKLLYDSNYRLQQSFDIFAWQFVSYNHAKS